jgi:dihydrolipoamide dehydrogenase
MDYQYDIAVIGAGPGGYETAIKAAQMGKKTCIIESTYLGGTCLNVGCIPTKTLIKTANVLDTVKHAADFAVEGVDLSALKVDMAKLQKRRQKVVSTLVGGVRGLLRGNKVDILEGTASFADTHTLTVGDKQVSAEYIIVATGSSVFMPPFIALEGENHLLTSTEALDLDQVPASVTVIGGGVIGVEFAYLLNRLGSKVTVLELMDHILPMVDIEVSRLAEKRMTKDGILFRLGAKVSRVKGDTVYYEYEGQECQVKSDIVLMAVGRVPNTQGLNAEGIGIEFDRKAIRTDAHMRTNIPHIYAIGDVNGKVMLAHTASHEGMVAVADICGQGEEMRYDRIPSCVYLEPEIACIGLTEAQAREKYGDGLKIGRFNMAANGKSLIAGDTDGLFKVIVAADTGEILGAHLYGQHVTDMIGEISAAMAAEGTAEELIHAIHPHPTVNEALGEAFMAAWNGRAINSL